MLQQHLDLLHGKFQIVGTEHAARAHKPRPPPSCCDWRAAGDSRSPALHLFRGEVAEEWASKRVRASGNASLHRRCNFSSALSKRQFAK